jgi:hypothetical protein
MESTPNKRTVAEALQQVSMVAANFGNAPALADVLRDWFTFLGGKPGEVVIVDGGSKPDTHAVYIQLFNEGKIDKLQLIRPDHFENHRDICFIQEHAAGLMAGKPYVLFFKSDTLPYRQGHENWLAEAIEHLDREDTFAVGGSFNVPSKHHDAWPGWYFSDKCSLNFSLMKRDSYVASMEEFAGSYIASGFRSTSPLEGVSHTRYLIESCFERYIENHKRYTLVKVEDPTWTVFHTNAQGGRLVQVREDYLARRDVERYMNAQIYNPVWGGCYYGRPELRWLRMKWALSRSPLGVIIRGVKRLMGAQPTARQS